ncbi:TPA: hypothetical protein ACV1MF_001525 [Campylobacter jejuni]
MKKIGFLAENFEANILNNDNNIVPIEFCNAIAYGQTGSGKTAGFILPNIEKRMESNHTLILYDYKGNLNSQVKAIAYKMNKFDKIVEIGVPWGVQFNLFESMKLNELESWHKKIIKDENYWSHSSLTLIKNVYEIFYYLKKINQYMPIDIIDIIDKEITFKLEDFNFTIFKSYFQVKKITTFIDKLSHFIENFHDKMLLYIKDENEKHFILSYFDNLNNNFNSLQNFKNLKGIESGTGNRAVVESVDNDLSEIGSNEFLNGTKKLSEILENGNIFIIHCDSFGEEISNLLHDVLFRFIKEKAFIEKYPTTFFIDEAQKIINKNNIPEVSVCREFQCEYILATQNDFLLKDILGVDKFYSISENISYQISFRNSKSEDHESLKDFEYKFVKDSKFYNENKKISRVEQPYFFKDKELYEAQMKYFQHLFSSKENNFIMKFKHNNEIINNELFSKKAKAFLKPNYIDKKNSAICAIENNGNMEYFEIEFCKLSSRKRKINNNLV